MGLSKFVKSAISLRSRAAIVARGYCCPPCKSGEGPLRPSSRSPPRPQPGAPVRPPGAAVGPGASGPGAAGPGAAGAAGPCAEAAPPAAPRAAGGASPGAGPPCPPGPPKEASAKSGVTTATDGQFDKNSVFITGVFENGNTFELTPSAKMFNDRSKGKLCEHLTELSAELRLGKAFVLTDIGDLKAVSVASYGQLGAGFNDLESLDEARENVRVGVGAAVRAAEMLPEPRVVPTDTVPDAAAEAYTLASWRFDLKKACGDRSVPRATATLESPGAAAAAGADGPDPYQTGVIMANSQNWARHVSEMPANECTPADFAQYALDLLCPLGVKIQVRDQAWLHAQKMYAFEHVARGSCQPPLMLECVYSNCKDQPPVLLVGKGVTFDCGGLCLKPPHAMVDNRGSMAGAAVVVAALAAAAQLKLPLNVVCLVPLCENMVSGQCMKVGDVVRAASGLSIQIEDTDMEGRLMLADALTYGQKEHRPSLVVDVATCSSGVVAATGGGAFGCFANKEALWTAARRAGALSGERPWRFPLWNYYQEQLTNEPAVDLRNRGSGRASCCLGAAFLSNFVCGDWLHFDITGVGKIAGPQAPTYLDPRLMTGRPTRALTQLLRIVADRKSDETRTKKEEPVECKLRNASV